MNRQEFVDALYEKLIEVGFPDEYASEQCDTLKTRLSELSEDYCNEANIEIVVKKLLAQDGELRRPAPTPQKPHERPSSKQDEPHIPLVETQPTVNDSDVEVVAAPLDGRSRRARAALDRQEEYVPCDHPKLLVTLLAILCAPTILLVLFASFGVFATVFVLLAASILLISVGIIAIVGGGSLISLASLLFGAMQLLSDTKYIGLHEIGFGLLVAGCTLAASIVLYNVAVRLVPFLFRKIAQLSKLFIKKLIAFTRAAVKGCEQL